MHDATLWMGWYVLLLSLPLTIIVVGLRDWFHHVLRFYFTTAGLKTAHPTGWRAHPRKPTRMRESCEPEAAQQSSRHGARSAA